MKVDGVDSIGMNYALIDNKYNAVGGQPSTEAVRFDSEIGMLVMQDGSIPVMEESYKVAYVNFSV